MEILYDRQPVGQGAHPGVPRALPQAQVQPLQPPNPSNIKFLGSRFVGNLPFDDVDLDIEFNGGDTVDGLFDMKVDYKFKQTFSYLADRPQEGSFMLYRKLNGSMWKTRMTIDNNNKQPKPFLDMGFEADRKTISLLSSTSRRTTSGR